MKRSAKQIALVLYTSLLLGCQDPAPQPTAVIYSTKDGTNRYVRINNTYYNVKHNVNARTPLGLVDDKLKKMYNHQLLAEIVYKLKGNNAVVRTDRSYDGISAEVVKPSKDELNDREKRIINYYR